MTDTPRRLFDEAEGLLRDAIDAAREDLPTDDQLDALAAKLGPLLGGGPGGGGGGGGAVASTGLGGLKIAGGLVGVAAAAVVAVYVAREPAADETAAPAPVEIADASLAVDASETIALVVDAGVDAGVEVVAEPTQRRPRPRDAPPPAEPVPEIELLRRAQDALTASPADALRAAEDHARAYPRGMLAQEREVIAIDALVRLGRRSEAEARAARFRERWPTSAQVRRIDTLVSPR